MKKYRELLAAICLMAGLVFASGEDENIIQAIIALALFCGAAALFVSSASANQTSIHQPEAQERATHKVA